jgi:dTDP-4-dehydrorhamnose reductase
MRILILGATGMLGHVLFKELSKDSNLDVLATARSVAGLEPFFSDPELQRICPGVDADNFDTIIQAFAKTQPDVVINCIGIIKQLPAVEDPLAAISVNSLLPHRLAMLAQTAKARLIHISTDCVFDGKRGMYTEEDSSNAADLYGRTKFLGEIDYPNCVTLRTSIIGHELKANLSLVDWFLSQKTTVKGFTKAIYSGFSTMEVVRIIRDFVLPNPELSGLFQVSSNPIPKYELLEIIRSAYDKNIELLPDDRVVVDRSLDSSRFQQVTGYRTPEWNVMVKAMSEHFLSDPAYRNKPFRSGYV